MIPLAAEERDTPGPRGASDRLCCATTPPEYFILQFPPFHSRTEHHKSLVILCATLCSVCLKVNNVNLFDKFPQTPTLLCC